MVQKALGAMNSAVNQGCLQSTDHFPCENQAVQYCPHTTQSVPPSPERRAGKDGLQTSLHPVKTMVWFPFLLLPCPGSTITNQVTLPHSLTLARVPRAKFLLFY